MKSCAACGFDEFFNGACEKCGLLPNGSKSESTMWQGRTEPKDTRFWLVLQIRTGITGFWLPILIERLNENDLFGFGPGVPNRQRWIYFCDDEEYEGELDLIYSELKRRFEEFAEILRSEPEEFRHIVQAVYWPKCLGTTALSQLVLDRYIFRHTRIAEIGFAGFWDRQSKNYQTLGFNRYFIEMGNTLLEISADSPVPLSDEERKLIDYFHGSTFSGDAFRARSWKNRWSK